MSPQLYALIALWSSQTSAPTRPQDPRLVYDGGGKLIGVKDGYCLEMARWAVANGYLVPEK